MRKYSREFGIEQRRDVDAALRKDNRDLVSRSRLTLHAIFKLNPLFHYLCKWTERHRVTTRASMAEVPCCAVQR